jgi:ankyrin repeat protein
MSGSKPIYISKVVIMVIVIALHLGNSFCWAQEKADSSKYLNAVRQFADNVLKYGRDTYGPKKTPLFVDGFNIHTHEPVKWKSPKGDVLKATEYNEWIISNFAAQQTLMRTLDGLTTLTGDPKYRDAAKQATKYVLENLRSPNGLIYWGNRAVYDALADRPNALHTRYYPAPYGINHVVKLMYPYYELMWEVNPKETRRFIEAFWSVHVKDWSNLDMDRGGPFDEIPEKPWDHEYQGGPVPFPTSFQYSKAFFNTGTGLALAGATLSVLSGEEQPLTWSKRLIQRYTDMRNPNTGISGYCYNTVTNSPPLFPVHPFAFRHMDFPEERHVHPWLALLLTGEMLGENGRPFVQSVLEELTAWGKASYRKEDNSFVPILIDGTNMEGHISEKFPNGYNVVEACPAGPQYLWAYSVAYDLTGDAYVWKMVRDIALGNGLGDVGNTPSFTTKLKTQTDCSHPYVLLEFLRLHQKTGRPEFLDMARHIADNIVLNRFHKDFFVPSKKHVYTMFDCFEPLALLHLEARIASHEESIPTVWPTLWKFQARYRFKEDGTDRLIIYTLADSNDPPLSLQEAASIGDFDTVRTLVNGGAGVDDLDPGDHIFKTPLYRAVVGGHEGIVRFLLSKGADINLKVRGPVETPLHWAVKNGQKTMVELLIGEGADVNAKNGESKTPIEVVGNRNRKEIIDLLKKHGATEEAPQSMIEKWQNMSPEERQKFMDEMRKRSEANKKRETKEPDISSANTETSETANSFLDAVRSGDIEQVKQQLAKGADVNSKTLLGQTPLHWAMERGSKDVVELLLEKGANLYAKTSRGHTPLDLAVMRHRNEIVNLAVRYDLESTDDPKPKHDLRIVNVSSPTVCKLGETVPITVTVTNGGTFRESFGVNLYSQTEDKEVATKSLILGKKWHGKADDIPDLIFNAEATRPDKMGNRVVIGGDANGNGYTDLLVCSSSWSDERGRACLYYGGPKLNTQPDVFFEGKEIGDKFSNQSGVFSDLNNDGFDDLIFGVPGRTMDEKHDGYVNIYYVGSSMDSNPDVVLRGETGSGENLGMTVAASDIDRDGYQDIVVGAQGYKGRGRVYLFWGGNPIDGIADVIFEGEYFTEAGPSATFNLNRDSPIPMTVFGRKISARGDVNGDGYNDVLVGARHAGGKKNNGAAYLYFGNSQGQMDNVCDWVYRGDGKNEQVGSSVEIFDIDADGYADVLVGARGAAVGHGRVYLFWGSKDFNTATPDVILEAPTISSMGGDHIACGYFNDDRYGDILAGALGYPGTTYMYGRAYLFYGNSKTAIDADLDYVFAGTCETDGFFGFQVSTGDVNGDGYSDALIGTPGANQGAGQAHLFYGPFHDTTNITFNWNTTNASVGKHTLKVEIAPVEGEENVENNVATVVVEVREK